MDEQSKRVQKRVRVTGIAFIGLDFISLWWGSSALDEWIGWYNRALVPQGTRLNENHGEVCA